jgi:hypothetical protein
MQLAPTSCGSGGEISHINARNSPWRALRFMIRWWTWLFNLFQLHRAERSKQVRS